jgi:exosortase/archaeosortase family protein
MSWGLWASTVFVLLYIVAFPVSLPLVRAVLAVFALSGTVSAYYLGRSMHFGILGLFLLSLPIVASLQFYLGYPARAVTAEVVANLLGLTGYPVTAEGTSLQWFGEVIAVDAPCSGIKMLWAGLYLNFTLACFHGASPSKTWVASVLTILTIFVGNTLRTTVLFYSEAHILTLPTWSHQGVGIVAFLGMALAIVSFHKQITGEHQCA